MNRNKQYVTYKNSQKECDPPGAIESSPYVHIKETLKSYLEPIDRIELVYRFKC